MALPERFQATLLDPETRVGWLDWATEFFTDPEPLQVPYVDITLQLDITAAYERYREQAPEGGSFFAFLVWHFVHAYREHPSFQLRRVHGHWYRVENAPVVIPVAVGGSERFCELILEDIARMDLPAFFAVYRQRLDALRRGERVRAAPETFYLAHFFGNLPNLQFTGLTLHYRREPIVGQTLVYFGRRYRHEGRTFIPMAAKLHHACTDPFVLDQLLQTVTARMEAAEPGGPPV